MGATVFSTSDDWSTGASFGEVGARGEGILAGSGSGINGRRVDDDDVSSLVSLETVSACDTDSGSVTVSSLEMVACGMFSSSWGSSGAAAHAAAA